MKATAPVAPCRSIASLAALFAGSFLGPFAGLLAFPSASWAAVPAPFAVQCDGVIHDSLERIVAVAADRLSPVDRLVSSVDPIGAPPRIDVWERPAPGATRELVDSLFLPEWDDSWGIYGVAAEGDRIVHQLWRNFEGVADLVIHERVGAGWETSVVSLPADENWLRFGTLAAVAGDQVLALTSRVINRPIRLQVLERGANGWGITQVLPLPDLRSPWFERQIELVHANGVIAILAEGSNDQVVAVCERDAAGIWSQTALLAPPSSDWFTSDIAIADGEIAVAWKMPPVTDLVEVFRRQASGTWLRSDSRFLTAQFDTQHPIAYDGEQLAVSDFDVTRVFERSGTGSLVPARSVRGRLSASDFSAGELVALGYRGIATVTVPLGLGHVDVCSHVGKITCSGSGSALLRVHEYIFNPQRRSVAEVQGAPPGAAVILFRSNEPGASPALGGDLCIDRAGAERVGAVLQASAVGTATFQLTPDGPLPNFGGIANADHLQAVVLGASPILTNSVAWLP